MATGEMKQKSLTDCPRCGQLCVGPTLLPCSHLLCHMCLVHLYQDTEPGWRPLCPTCQDPCGISPVATGGQVQVREWFSPDVVMERLVTDRLVEQAGGSCCVPHPPPSSSSSSSSSSPPSHLCLNCGEIFCDSCSHVHRSSSATRSHTLKPLEALVTPRSLLSTRPRQNHFDDDDDDDDERDEDTEDDQKNVHLEDVVRTERQLFRQTLSAWDQVTHSLKVVLTHRENERHVLSAYGDHLIRDDVSFDDITLQRLSHVRQECQAVAEADMETLSQMQLRKEAGTKGVSKYRGTRLEGRHPRMTWNPFSVAVCVALPVLVSVLIALLLLSSQCADPNPRHYTAGKVALQPVTSGFFSQTRSLCGRQTCSARYRDWIMDVLVTSDGTVVLAMDTAKFIVVKSSLGVQTVKLGCSPLGMTELPRRRIAVTCPDTSEVLLVSLESRDDHPVERIPTGTSYSRVAAHPMDETLIAETTDRINIITLQGEVVRTLLHSDHLFKSFTVVNEFLMVTVDGSDQIHRIRLSDSNLSTLVAVEGRFPSALEDIAMDKAGNVFAVLEDGVVMVRDTEGQERQLLAGWGGGEICLWCYIDLHGDRLLLTTVVYKPRIDSVVTEYQLLDQ